MSKNKGIIIVCVGAVWLIFMAVMFHSSGTPYKDQDMKPFLRKTIQLERGDLPSVSFYYDHEKVTTQEPYDFVEFIIRKLGHITEYTVLSCLSALMLLLTRIKAWKGYLFGGLFSLFFAATDEWHQLFVPGRTGHLIDVVTFDLFGVLLGLLMTLIIRGVRPHGV